RSSPRLIAFLCWAPHLAPRPPRRGAALLIRGARHDFIEDFHPTPQLLHRDALVGGVLAGVNLLRQLESVEPVAGDSQRTVHLAFRVAAVKHGRHHACGLYLRTTASMVR